MQAPKSRHEYRSAELVKDVMIPVKEDFGTDAEAEIAWTACINLVKDIITFSERYKVAISSYSVYNYNFIMFVGIWGK